MPDNKINEEENVSLASMVVNQKPSEFKDAVRDKLFDAVKAKIAEYKPEVANQIFNGVNENE